jgi:hypothetical protein
VRDHAVSPDEARALPARTATLPAPGGDAFAHVQAAIGNRALARMVASSQVLARDEKDKPAAAAKPAPVGTDEGWSAAGPWGDKVRGLLEDHLTTKDLGSLLDLLPDLAGQGASAAVGAAGPKGIEGVRLSPEEAAKLTSAVGTWGTKAAEKWLASPNGKKFLDAVRTKLGNNPKTVYWTLVSIVAAGLGTAVALYAAGKIDPPMLQKEFKLGKDWTLKGGVDLGKPQEQWFQSALLGVGWQATPLLNMDLGSTFAYKAAAKDTPDTYTLGGAYSFKLLDADDKKKTALTGSLAGEYAWGTGAWKANAGLHGDVLGVGYGLVSGPKNTAMTFTGDANLVKDALKLQVKGVMNSDAKKATTGADGKPVAGVSDTLGATVSGKAGGFDYSAAATWDLTEQQLGALSLHLGHATKDETVKWLVDIAHSMQGAEQTDTGKASLQLVVKDYVLRVEARLNYAKDAWSGGGVASLGIPLWKSGITVAPMLGAGYGAWDKDVGADKAPWLMGGAGISYKDVPGVSLYGAYNQPLSGAPGFFSIGIGGYLGRPDPPKKKD